MKRRITTERWTEIYSQMRMDSRDIMNTASSWPYGWPIGTYSPLFNWRVLGRKWTLFVYIRPGFEFLCKRIPKDWFCLHVVQFRLSPAHWKKTKQAIATKFRSNLNSAVLSHPSQTNCTKTQNVEENNKTAMLDNVEVVPDLFRFALDSHNVPWSFWSTLVDLICRFYCPRLFRPNLGQIVKT